MAMAKLTVLVLLLGLLASFALSVSAGRNYGNGSLKPSQCGSQCNRRCSANKEKIGRHNACLDFCNKCCQKCLCVPPGTFGNKQVCPCYNSWKTQQGGPKCP